MICLYTFKTVPEQAICAGMCHEPHPWPHFPIFIIGDQTAECPYNYMQEKYASFQVTSKPGNQCCKHIGRSTNTFAATSKRVGSMYWIVPSNHANSIQCMLQADLLSKETRCYGSGHCNNYTFIKKYYTGDVSNWLAACSYCVVHSCTQNL